MRITGLLTVIICASGASAQEAPKLLQRFYPDVPVSLVAFSPDGGLMAIGGGRDQVGVIDTKTRKLVAKPQLMTEDEEATIAAHGNRVSMQVRALSFSHDSSMLAIGHSTGQVKMFDARSGQQKLALDGVRRDTQPLHEYLKLPLAQGRIWRIACSPDGKWVATCGEPIDYKRDGIMTTAIVRRGLVTTWDAASGSVKHGFNDLMTIQIFDVAFSPNGKLVAIVGGWLQEVVKVGNGAMLCDVESGKVVKELIIPVDQRVGTNTFTIRFSADGKRAALGAVHPKEAREKRGSIYVFDTESAELQVGWDVLQPVSYLSMSRDGRMIASKSAGNTIALYDATSGKQMHVLRPVGNPEGIKWTTFEFSPTEDLLAITGSDGKNRKFVEFWEL